MFYLYKTQVDFVRLNEILFNLYVKDKDGNFIFPIDEGTTCYIDVNDPIVLVSQPIEMAEMLLDDGEDKDFLIDALSKKIWVEE